MLDEHFCWLTGVQLVWLFVGLIKRYLSVCWLTGMQLVWLFVGLIKRYLSVCWLTGMDMIIYGWQFCCTPFLTIFSFLGLTPQKLRISSWYFEVGWVLMFKSFLNHYITEKLLNGPDIVENVTFCYKILLKDPYLLPTLEMCLIWQHGSYFMLELLMGPLLVQLNGPQGRFCNTINCWIFSSSKI